MNILPTFLVCLCLSCGFSRGDQASGSAPVRFWIDVGQTARDEEPQPIPDQSTPLNATKLLLRAFQEKTDWNQEPYQSLPATSPFASPLRLKSILARMEVVRAYVTEADPERPPFVDEASIREEGDLATACVLLPDRADPYTYSVTAVALVKKDGQWKASLTPGSFESTFLPFDDHVRAKAAQLSSAAKEKAVELARQYSTSAVNAALERVRSFRQDAVKGKTDSELLHLLIHTVKRNDPALIAALLVPPNYKETAITQNARLTPVVKAMRLQDRRDKNRYTQPTRLGFMSFPATILVPLSPHPDDQLDPNKNLEKQREELRANNAKQPAKDILSIGAITILPPRMNMPNTDKPVFIYRYALEKIKDPTDGIPVFKMNMAAIFNSWAPQLNESTTARVMADFHSTYPPMAFPTPDEAITAAGRALAKQDSLTLIRMLAPTRFASTREFESALSQLKSVMGSVHAAGTWFTPDEIPSVQAAYISVPGKNDNSEIKATIGVRTSPENEVRVNNLYLIKTDGGWMISGADTNQPLDLEG